MAITPEEGPDEVRAAVEETGLTVLGSLSFDADHSEPSRSLRTTTTRIEVVLPGTRREVIRVERTPGRFRDVAGVYGLGIAVGLDGAGSALRFALDFRRRYGDLTELERETPWHASTAEYERLLRVREALLRVPLPTLMPLVTSVGGATLLTAVDAVWRAGEPGPEHRALLAPVVEAVLAGAPLEWALRRFPG